MWATVCTTEEEGVPGRVHVTHKKQGRTQGLKPHPLISDFNSQGSQSANACTD